ncbi:MAG: response regulator [Holophaga sp.]|nr:response regulator [Holophaga sp.]
MIDSTDVMRGSILIVDDQEANVLLLEQMLRSAGYSAITSTMNPTKVCELHLVNRYDLILLDLQMPGMDGFQVMENLKQIETGGYLPILVITAQAGHKLRALKAGARDFVSKPFDLAEVLLRVYNLLEVRLLHLEALRLYDQVAAEQKVSERLLSDLLPHSLAEILKGLPEAAARGPQKLIAESHAEVIILFADIVAFTRFAEGASARVLSGVLNDIAARLPDEGDVPGRKRSDTLDDAYLASMDLSDLVADHTIRTAEMALDLSEALDRFNARSSYQIRLRISLDGGAGPGKAPYRM